MLIEEPKNNNLDEFLRDIREFEKDVEHIHDYSITCLKPIVYNWTEYIREKYIDFNKLSYDYAGKFTDVLVKNNIRKAVRRSLLVDLMVELDYFSRTCNNENLIGARIRLHENVLPQT